MILKSSKTNVCVGFCRQLFIDSSRVGGRRNKKARFETPFLFLNSCSFWKFNSKLLYC